MRRPPNEPPPIRIEPPAPEPTPPPSTGLGGRARIAVAGLAGLALGFLLAVSLRPSGEPSDLAAGPTTVPLPEPTTAAPVTATSTELPGELVVVTGVSGGEVVARAVSTDGTSTIEGRLIDGLRTTSLAWNSDRTAIAGLGRGPAGTALYAGPPGAMVPVTLAASSFAWHDTDPGRIAWTERADGGDTLFTGDVMSRDFGLHEAGPVDGPVVGFGEWGYLIQSFVGATEVQLLHPEGVVTRPGSIAAVNTLYRSVPVFADPEQPPEVVILDVVARRPVAVDLAPNAFQVTVAPSLRRAAWVVQTGARQAELRVQSLAGDEPTVIPIPPAQLLDWSPDGSLVALQATTTRVEDDSVFRPLLVVEIATGTVHTVDLERGDVIGASVRATP